MMYRTPIRWTTLLLTVVILSACGGSSDDDSGVSTDVTPAIDDDTGGGGTDEGTDGGTDVGTDGGTDEGTDGGTDEGTDGGTDGGTDEGTDGGMVVLMKVPMVVLMKVPMVVPMEVRMVVLMEVPMVVRLVVQMEGTDGGTVGGEETGLETASRIENVDTYTRLINIVGALEADVEFTSENYQGALSAVAEGSQSSLVFQRARFLALLETQIQEGTSGLDFLNISEGSFNRVHICPNGGRLLSTKADDAVPGDLSGNYRFEECIIGDIFIDGRYSSSETLFGPARLDVSISYSGFRMIGTDGVETELNRSYGHIITAAANNTGGEILTTISNDSTLASIGIDNVGVLEIARLTAHTETAEAGSVDVEVPLVAAGRAVRLSSVSMSVQDDQRVTLRARATTDFAESPEGTTFEQGEMELTLNGAPNRLRLQAANGDPLSYDVFILQDDNSVVSFNVPWADSDLDFGSLERLPGFTAPR